MRIRTKRILIMIMLLGGIILNCLLLLNDMAFDARFPVIPAVFLIVLISDIGEKSKQYSELTSREKTLSFITLALASVWAVTLLVYLARQV